MLAASTAWCAGAAWPGVFQVTPLILGAGALLKEGASTSGQRTNVGPLAPVAPGARGRIQDPGSPGRSALLLSPVRRGMEIDGVLAAVVRQHVENLLSAVAYAIGGRNVTMLEELLRGVSVRLDGEPGSEHESPARAVLAWFGHPRTGQVQTVNNIAVHVSGEDASYYATFQN